MPVQEKKAALPHPEEGSAIIKTTSVTACKGDPTLAPLIPAGRARCCIRTAARR